MDSIDTLIAARVSKPAGIVSGEVPVWNGTTWVRSSVTNVGPSSLGSGTPDATKFLRGDGSWQVLAGAELDYAQQTTNQTSVATTAATATAIVTGNAVTYDGSTVVLIEFYVPQATHSVATTQISFQLYDGSTDLGTITQSLSGNAGATGPFAVGRRRLTPSAAAHTYSIRMWSGGAGTTTAAAGAGGAGVLLPLFIRITKV